MPHEATLIATVAAGLGLAMVFGFIAAKLRMPPLVGYLVAGIAIGPHTRGFVGDVALAGQLADIGRRVLEHAALSDDPGPLPPRQPDHKLDPGPAS